MDTSLRRLPGTGMLYREGEATLFPQSLYIAGESPAVVERAVDELVLPLGYKKGVMARGFREFTVLKYAAPVTSQSVNVLISGIGSSSVEITLQEAYLCGGRYFLMTGTCAGLKRREGESLKVGDICVPSFAVLRPGAISEYFSGVDRVESPPELTNALRDKVKSLTNQRRVTDGCCLSVDAFYGVGGSIDATGVPTYAGGALKGEKKPGSIGLALDNPLDCEILDMEIAPFLALGNALEGACAVAMKIVANPIPWDASYTADSSDGLLTVAVRLGFSALYGKPQKST